MSKLSPFPGMDPFLEEPTMWSGVHHRLISSSSDQLAAAVSPNFFVSIEQRVYIVSLDEPGSQRRAIVPDVYLVTGVRDRQPAERQSAITTPTLIEPLHDLEIRDRYINILDTQSREVVTTIEVLSPFNKTPGAPGFEAFRQKRQTIMASRVHWLEIDLLRAGERPLEVAGQSDYYALLKRGGHPVAPFEVWFFNLRDTLPTIAVPLRPPFADVPLNLQTVFNDLYTRAYYADSIDYTRDIPLPRLKPADEAWVKAQAGQI